MGRASLVLLLVTCFFFVPAFAQNRTNGTISGFVFDEKTGEGLIGANVFLQNTYFGSSTNASGFYSIPKIDIGRYTLTCQYIGYETFTQDITLKPGGLLKIDIRLTPTEIVTQEVFVVADSERTSMKLYRKPISKISMSPRQIQNAPQVIEADLLRSLQTMPGIASVSDFSSELYVRGGTPDQNLYLVDGTDVYNPEHFFGLFSTFNTDAIKNVEFSKGGYGAEYGGRLSSVLNVTNLDGNRREYTGKASMSLLSAKTTMQLPLGKIGALSGSFRRTYFDQTIAKAKAFKDYNIPDYYFYDGHLKTFLDLGEADNLTISTYKGYDDLDFYFDENRQESEKVTYDWGNTTASIRWTHIFSPSMFGNFWLTHSDFDSYFGFEDIDEDIDMDDQTIKGNIEYYFASNLNFKIGIENKFLRAAYKSNFPGGEVDVEQKPRHFSAFVQSEWRPTPLMEYQIGLRYNTCVNGVVLRDLDPRFSVKYRLTDTVNLKGAFGRYHQYLFRIPRAFITDIWASSDEYYADAKSNHYIVGFQKEVAQDFELEIESYYKHYDNLYFYDPFFYTDLTVKQYNKNGEPLYRDIEGLFYNGEGYSYGFEMLLRKDTGPITGWFSYTLGRARFKIIGVNQNRYFEPRHDRTSTLNLVANVDLNNTIRLIRGQAIKDDRNKWRIGFGLTYASGQPITTTSSVYVSSPLPDQDYYSGYNLYPTRRNNFRLPPYFRFDLSITYIQRYKNLRFEPYLQVYNVTNRRNVWFISYDDKFEDGKITQEIEPTQMLPIIPSVGVNLIF